MPYTIGEYTYDLLGGDDYRYPVRVGKPSKSFPFKNDTSTYFLHERFHQFIEYYKPLAPATRHSTIGNVFYVGDSQISDIGDGIGMFERQWSMLPGMSSDGKKSAFVRSQYTSHVMTVPGIVVLQGTFQQYPVSLGSYYISNGKHIITAQASHDIAVGKACMIFYQMVDPLSNQPFLRQAARVALTGTSGATLVIDEIKDTNTIQPIGIQRLNTNQNSYQKVVNGRIDYTYYLPGVTVNSTSDIEMIEPFYIIEGSTGNRSDSLSDNSTPTLDQYMTKIGEKAWMPVECVTRGWPDEDSPIIERAVIYVRYQF